MNKNRKKMDIGERAKQFAPFAALGNLEKAFAKVEARPMTYDKMKNMPKHNDEENIFEKTKKDY